MDCFTKAFSYLCNSQRAQINMTTLNVVWLRSKLLATTLKVWWNSDLQIEPQYPRKMRTFVHHPSTPMPRWWRRKRSFTSILQNNQYQRRRQSNSSQKSVSFIISWCKRRQENNQLVVWQVYSIGMFGVFTADAYLGDGISTGTRRFYWTMRRYGLETDGFGFWCGGCELAELPKCLASWRPNFKILAGDRLIILNK